ncbi:hypothetical protein [Sphingomonas sp. 35-24ZXX]|uniref:hypothetical protein n=1 Tax=Sphingomonas sp. 35-24ZXX TaxID=1545915 RepID=UPI000B1E3AB3|nr:hypothetical protein [Sphingomonas sp. 35-24ZXX]
MRADYGLVYHGLRNVWDFRRSPSLAMRTGIPTSKATMLGRLMRERSGSLSTNVLKA